MKYSILTPTFNRPEPLLKCLNSVLFQNHKDFEMIIINDSPLYDYSEVEKYIQDKKDSRIKYFKNEKNSGVNFSRNFALANISDDSDYVIFLDDDDWLHSNALSDIENILISNKNKNKKINWLVTNRSIGNTSLTENKTKKSKLNYFFDYLIFKRFVGDCTHTIDSNTATKYKFSEKVKNGEEWTYFIQLPTDIHYENINTTNSEGYNDLGLNASMQKSYRENTRKLFGEIKNCKMIIMLILRSLNSLLRKNY